MNKKSLPTCIKDNDLEAAYERLQETTKQWFDYWWDGVVEIFNNDKATWSQKYILDIQNHVLEKITRPISHVDGRIKYCCDNAEGQGSYIVQHYDIGNKLLWTKCGKADNVKTRTRDYLNSKTACNAGVAYGECLYFFPARSSDEAEAKESIIRNYFKQNYTFIRNDRFSDLLEITEKDIERIKKACDMIERAFDLLKEETE
jgi:hypothetical protein